MRRVNGVAALFVFGSVVCAQHEPAALPRVANLTRLDGGLSGTLHLADGSQRLFFLEVGSTRVRLVASRTAEDGEPALAVGSKDELELLALLQAWAKARFSAEDTASLLALERLPDPRTQEQDFEHREQSLLRDLRLYEETTRAKFTKVFAGRGTVGLSLQVQLADAAPRQLLWRSLGDRPFARLHFDTDVEAIPMESRDERKLLLAMANWLRERVGGEARLHEGEAADLPADVQLVLRAYRGYLAATSPRLRTVAVVMDAPRGGSLVFDLSDARNRLVSVRFDHDSGTKTPGRMLDGAAQGSPLIAIGSAREQELLAMLRRAAQLRRSWLGAGADQDYQLGKLEKELAAYDAAFAPQAGK
jgi:hypothetical protein